MTTPNINIKPILTTLNPGEIFTVEEKTVDCENEAVNVLEIALEPVLVEMLGTTPIYFYFEDEPF